VKMPKPDELLELIVQYGDDSVIQNPNCIEEDDLHTDSEIRS